MNNPTNLYDIIPAHKVGPAPLYIKTQITPTNVGLVEGVPSKSTKYEYYVLLSILPEELRKRVELAVQVAQSAM